MKMKNYNYKVSRDDVYVGNVCGINPEKIEVYPDGLYDYAMLDYGLVTEEEIRKDLEGRNFLFRRNVEQLYYPSFESFRRTMLFVLDENNCANDLLYDSPHYPIFNISSNKDCLNSSICILEYTYQLSKVLQYFEYPEQLGYEDIVKIRKSLFNCNFVLDNCELFGRYETDPHETSYEIHDSNGNHRTFNLIKEDSVLSFKYFDCLVFNRDCFHIEHIDPITGKFTGHVIDSFLPKKQEGKIRSLRK